MSIWGGLQLCDQDGKLPNGHSAWRQIECPFCIRLTFPGVGKGVQVLPLCCLPPAASLPLQWLIPKGPQTRVYHSRVAVATREASPSGTKLTNYGVTLRLNLSIYSDVHSQSNHHGVAHLTFLAEL